MLSEWRAKRPTKEVEERFGHSTTLYKNKLFIFGGLYEQNGSPLCEDFTQFNLFTNDFQNTEKNTLFQRLRHTTVQYKDSFFVFGGSSSNLCGDEFHNTLSEFNINKREWSVVIPKSREVPKPRFKHSSVLIGHFMYIFGGFSVQDEIYSTFFDDVWKYNILTREWEQLEVENSILPRMGHSCTSKGNSMFIFGGKDAINRYQDLQELSFDDNTWRELPCEGDIPEKRSSGTLNCYKNRLYLFGGFDGERDLADLYEYNLDFQLWRKIHLKNSIPGRSFHTTTLVDNQIVPYLVVFGGIYEDFHTTKVYNDMYTIELDHDKMVQNIAKSNDYLDVLIIF